MFTFNFTAFNPQESPWNRRSFMTDPHPRDPSLPSIRPSLRPGKVTVVKTGWLTKPAPKSSFKALSRLKTKRFFVKLMQDDVTQLYMRYARVDLGFRVVGFDPETLKLNPESRAAVVG